MPNWLILSKAEDLEKVATEGYATSEVRDYLSFPERFANRHLKIINLASSYAYQSRGYYASLLADARGHKVLPSAETINDLSDPKLYANALPELEDLLNKCISADVVTAMADRRQAHIHVYFGTAENEALERFARLLFDWFRAPCLRVTVEPGDWLRITAIQLRPLAKLNAEQRIRLFDAMRDHARRPWRGNRQTAPARFSLGILHDPAATMPPSTVHTLKHFSKIALRHGIECALLTKRDLAKVANHDALFIRETTSITNHTYQFARRAQQEHMPVIDDPGSMIRCTNKVYLHELMHEAKIAMPRSRVVSSLNDLEQCADVLGFPMVLKIPDGSFSVGVKKAGTLRELRRLAGNWFKDTDLLIAQEFMPTKFDWRVGVLGGKPIFVTRYTMARSHWQIVKYRDGKSALEGGFKPCALEDAPAGLLEIAATAAAKIGNGLYGVDIKETQDGFFVIEINDNPNIEHGIEDYAERDTVWTSLAQWFIHALDRDPSKPNAGY